MNQTDQTMPNVNLLVMSPKSQLQNVFENILFKVIELIEFLENELLKNNNDN